MPSVTWIDSILSEAATERPRRTLLGALRIRKKLILLHTFFSLALAGILLLALRPAIHRVVRQAEVHACRVAIQTALAGDDAPLRVEAPGLTVRTGSAAEVGIPSEVADAARRAGDRETVTRGAGGWPRVVRWDPERAVFVSAAVQSESARGNVRRLYALVALALFVVYGLIALALEAFVLPRQVWTPIARLREADQAVQEGRRDEEIIPESQIPQDELGEIMRSRNDSIRKLRKQEKDLAAALEELERVANDLVRKNYLLETVWRNMADQDRLVSLGMMSAGIAHELNTPLSVLKGSVERLAEAPQRGVARSQAQLMLRTVRRLERISENLLDFARARPQSSDRVPLSQVVEDAWELVRLDREAREVRVENDVPKAATVAGDADRLEQVFVNLLRNAVDAMEGVGRIEVSAVETQREGGRWLSVICRDTGPGIDPAILPRLFEPFATTRLDSRGTGLGLAVAEGIVREHGGVILVRNAPGGGAVFEVMLPLERPAGSRPDGEDAGAQAPGAESAAAGGAEDGRGPGAADG